MHDDGGTGSWQVSPMHLDTVHYPDWHPFAGQYGPVYAYLLESGGRTVLVDTGIGPPNELINRLYEPERRDLVIELLKHGVEPGELNAIVVSHLHFDHIGGAWNFPGVPMYVQRAEWEAAQAPKYTIPAFLEFRGANFRLVDGNFEVAPGLRVLATPGHTPGHQAVVAATPEGTTVLACQALDSHAEMVELVARGEVAAWATDERAAQRTESALRILACAPVRVLFSHDHAVWEREPA
jgi:glyoxylase-like metal-dependent hydrolase (beta-lactamase superfamily II)